MVFSNFKRPCFNVGGVSKIFIQNACDVSQDSEQQLTFIKEDNFIVPFEFAEYEFTRSSAVFTENEENNRNGKLVKYKLTFDIAKATLQNEIEINKLRKSDKVIVILQDNNRNFRVIGQKCNPSTVKVAYNSGKRKGNQNIYTIEIEGAEIQKPFRLPIPADPPYLPTPKSVIPVMLTVASRTLVFKANWDYLGQRIFRMYGGLTEDSFVFKVNPNPLAVDESHPSWASLPYLNPAQFISSNIQNGFQVWIECVFIDLLVTEVLIETGKATISLTNSIVVPQHYQTAASSFLLALPNVGSSSTNVSSPISTNLFYGRRPNSDFIAGEDFTDFTGTLADVNAGLNFGDAADLYLENIVPLTVPLTNSVVNVNFGSGNYEVAQIEQPGKKRYYPFTTNPNSVKSNNSNTKFVVPDSPTGSRLFSLQGMQIGEERSYTTLSTPRCIFGNFGSQSSTSGANALYIGFSNFFVMDINFTGTGVVGGGVIQYKFVPIPLPNNQRPIYCTFRIRRKAFSGTAAACFDVEMFINIKKLTPQSQLGSTNTSVDPFPAIGYHFGGRFSDNVCVSNMHFWQLNKRWITEEEITALHLKQTIPAEYKYVFDSITPDNKILPSGTLTHDPVLIQGATLPISTSLLYS
jgi:hypothetical protein